MDSDVNSESAKSLNGPESPNKKSKGILSFETELLSIVQESIQLPHNDYSQSLSSEIDAHVIPVVDSSKPLFCKGVCSIDFHQLEFLSFTTIVSKMKMNRDTMCYHHPECLIDLNLIRIENLSDTVNLCMKCRSCKKHLPMYIEMWELESKVNICTRDIKRLFYKSEPDNLAIIEIAELKYFAETLMRTCYKAGVFDCIKLIITLERKKSAFFCICLGFPESLEIVSESNVIEYIHLSHYITGNVTNCTVVRTDFPSNYLRHIDCQSFYFCDQNNGRITNICVKCSNKQARMIANRKLPLLAIDSVPANDISEHDSSRLTSESRSSRLSNDSSLSSVSKYTPNFKLNPLQLAEKCSSQAKSIIEKSRIIVRLKQKIVNLLDDLNEFIAEKNDQVDINIDSLEETNIGPIIRGILS
jgi:hypothetical protein